MFCCQLGQDLTHRTHSVPCSMRCRRWAVAKLHSAEHPASIELVVALEGALVRRTLHLRFLELGPQCCPHFRL